jgi:hypothetical protein
VGYVSGVGLNSQIWQKKQLYGEVILTACLDDHLVEQAFIKMTCHSNLGFLLEKQEVRVFPIILKDSVEGEASQ